MLFATPLRSFSLNFASPCASMRSISCVLWTKSAVIFCDVRVRVPRSSTFWTGSITAFAPPVAVNSARDVSALEKLAIDARRGQGFRVSLRVLNDRIDKQLRISNGLGFVQIAASRRASLVLRHPRSDVCLLRVDRLLLILAHARLITERPSVRICFSRLRSPWA